MKRILLSIVLAGFSASGCGSHTQDEDTDKSATRLTQSKKFLINVTWKEGPVKAKEDPLADDRYSTAEIKLLSPDGKTPKSAEMLEVKPWMKIHGHGINTVPVIKQLEPNVFEVSNILFTMSGPWELNITAKVDGHKDSIEYKVDVGD